MKNQITLLLVFAVAAAAPLRAQLGDRPGDTQGGFSDEWKIPDAPALQPAEALASIYLPPGFRVELVAAEPLVADPVAMAFDRDGGLWVVEMPGYNREILDILPVYLPKDRPAPDLPDGKIVRLEDTDGDGEMDRRVVFLDGLRLPRTGRPGIGKGGLVETASRSTSPHRSGRMIRFDSIIAAKRKSEPQASW